MERENKLDREINITKLGQNQERYFSLNKSQDWVRELLIELNEKADEKSPEDYLNQTSLNIGLDIKKIFDAREGEKLLVSGNLVAKYMTQCIRTLEPMEDELDLDIKACFIDSSNQDNDMYVDQTETFQENEMYDLYFYDNKKVKLSEMIHEQVFLNYNEYPVKDPDAELVWAKPAPEGKQ